MHNGFLCAEEEQICYFAQYLPWQERDKRRHREETRNNKILQQHEGWRWCTWQIGWNLSVQTQDKSVTSCCIRKHVGRFCVQCTRNFHCNESEQELQQKSISSSFVSGGARTSFGLSFHCQTPNEASRTKCDRCRQQHSRRSATVNEREQPKWVVSLIAHQKERSMSQMREEKRFKT